jgi:hypothetical protein
LSARWLFRRLVRLGWHPLLRIKTGGTFRPDPQAAYRPLASFVLHPGMRWHGFQEPTAATAVHRVGARGRGVQRSLAAPDRCAT